MGLFQRKNREQPDLGLLLLQGEDMIGRLVEAHAAAWGLGSGERWDLDQHEGCRVLPGAKYKAAPYITFGAVTVRAAGEESTTFRVEVE